MTACGSDDTVKQGGESGDCIFCGHQTQNGTPWPEGGVVCPCGSCLLRGMVERRYPGDREKLVTIQSAVSLGALPDSPYVPPERS